MINTVKPCHISPVNRRNFSFSNKHSTTLHNPRFSKTLTLCSYGDHIKMAYNTGNIVLTGIWQEPYKKVYKSKSNAKYGNAKLGFYCIWWEQIFKSHSIEFSPVSCHFLHLSPKYLLQHSIFKNCQPLFFPKCDRTSSTPTWSNVSSNNITFIMKMWTIYSSDMSQILSITTGQEPEHITPGDKCTQYFMLPLHLSSSHALLGTVRSGLCTDHRKQVGQSTNPGTDASRHEKVVLIISDGGAECLKALYCWNCSLITLLQWLVEGAIHRTHRHKVCLPSGHALDGAQVACGSGGCS